jgi:hypothetical protein
LDENKKIVYREIIISKAAYRQFYMALLTKAYGLPIPFAGLQDVRQFITPFVSMTFRPVFTKEFSAGIQECHTGIDRPVPNEHATRFSNTMLGALSSYKPVRCRSSDQFNPGQTRSRAIGPAKLFVTLNSFPPVTFLRPISLNWSSIYDDFPYSSYKKISSISRLS